MHKTGAHTLLCIREVNQVRNGGSVQWVGKMQASSGESLKHNLILFFLGGVICPFCEFSVHTICGDGKSLKCNLTLFLKKWVDLSIL